MYVVFIKVLDFCFAISIFRDCNENRTVIIMYNHTELVGEEFLSTPSPPSLNFYKVIKRYCESVSSPKKTISSC